MPTTASSWRPTASTAAMTGTRSRPYCPPRRSASSPANPAQRGAPRRRSGRPVKGVKSRGCPAAGINRGYRVPADHRSWPIGRSAWRMTSSATAACPIPKQATVAQLRQEAHGSRDAARRPAPEHVQGAEAHRAQPAVSVGAQQLHIEFKAPRKARRPATSSTSTKCVWRAATKWYVHLHDPALDTPTAAFSRATSNWRRNAPKAMARPARRSENHRQDGRDLARRPHPGLHRKGWFP